MEKEPVLILDAVKAVLIVLSTLGVVFLDDAVIAAIVGVVGAGLTLWTAIGTRKRVTPTAKLPIDYR